MLHFVLDGASVSVCALEFLFVTIPGSVNLSFFLSSCCDIDTFVGSHPVDILDLAGCFKSSSFLQPLQFHFLVDLTFQLN